MGKCVIFCLLVLLGSSPVAAAPLTVRIVDGAAKPVVDAVVTLRPDGVARPMRIAGAYVVSQQNLQFHPYVRIVPVGATVSFPNLDPTKHHVYSFSPVRRFELKLFARDQSRSVRFDKAGIVALGCNIHDQMSAYIVVTDSAWTAKTDRQGVARFEDIPSVTGSLTVWHPYLRAPGGNVSRRLAANVRSANVQVRLRPPPMHSMEAY
jgi:plastocyanin